MNCPGWVHNLTPFIFKITDNFGIRWYGLAYVIGFLGGWGLMVFLAKRKLISLNPEEIGDFIFTLAIGIVAGGRIGYALFYSPDIFTTFTSSFPYWELLAFHHGGMASHGGMIGFVLA
ncbi:MAG: prolipoprotein diacylglyceryl transferase, partial [Candidatus Dadabacteria bacterium]